MQCKRASLVGFLFLRVAWAQQPGDVKANEMLPMSLQVCTKAACCQSTAAAATIDANWRWVHEKGGYTNCQSSGQWDATFCPSPQACAENCVLEGVDLETYRDAYGVQPVPGGLQMNFITGSNVGSRMFLVDPSSDAYQVFYLKNREIAFTVDLSSLPCGLTAAVYLLSMDPKGAQSKQANSAGAAYGTGYCDAQCPEDVKFMDGTVNINGSHSCCMEMDLFEGNTAASQMAAHTCDTPGQYACEGPACKETCDKPGCGFNAYRMNAKSFWGIGGVVDTSKPVTVITQFITDDGTDTGALSEIRRLFVQDGQCYQNVYSQNPAIPGNALTEQYCSNIATTFAPSEKGGSEDFLAKGGMAKMDAALGGGMVLAMSIWDDPSTQMRWLDSVSPLSAPATTPGRLRGPCDPALTTEQIRAAAANSAVNFTDFKYGEVDATQCFAGSDLPTASMPGTMSSRESQCKQTGVPTPGIALYAQGTAVSPPSVPVTPWAGGLVLVLVAAAAAGWRHRFAVQDEAGSLEQDISRPLELVTGCE